MTVHRPGRVLRPDRPRRADRLRRGLPDRRLGRRRPGRLPDRPRRRDRRRWCPRRCSGSAGCTSRGDPAPYARTRPTPATTSPTTTTCPTTCSGCSSTRRMSYSSALFAPFEAGTPDADPVDPATWRPRRSARSSGCSTRPASGAGSRVLEIGTGWGELAIRAARRGATVRSVTLSSEQQALARERIAAAGVRRPGRRSSCCDYRAVADGDGYDAVLSVEMIEAVGLRVLVDVLLHHRPGARTRRPGRDPGDHDAPRPDARHPRLAHLDQQVHLPRRLPALGRGDRRDHPARHDAAAGRPAGVRQPLRRDAAAVGRARSAAAARPRWPRSGSTRRSCGCGTSTWSTPAPASRPGTSTCTSWCWRDRGPRR